MTLLRNRRIDRAGQVVFDTDGLVDLLYEGFDALDGLTVEPCPEMDAYNRALRQFLPSNQPLVAYQGEPEDIAAADRRNTETWFTPEPYASLDVRAYVLEKCGRSDEVARVELEMAMFEERDMIPMLRFLIYFVHHLREHKVLWGLGRGSSVASYVLFKIGVHRIDSLKFSLDITEFLK